MFVNVTVSILLTYLQAELPTNDGAPSATQATGTPACWLQGCDARSSVAVWHFTVVPSRRLPSCRRCSWATTTLHNEPNLRCDADIRTPSATEHLQLLDPDYGTAFHRNWKRRTYRTIDSVAIAKGIFIFFLFGAVWTILIASFRNNFTYLLAFWFLSIP